MSLEVSGGGGGRGAAEAAPHPPADAAAGATINNSTSTPPSTTAAAADAASSSPVRSTHPSVRYADFCCPICLDLLYKPCAPTAEHCSHVFCFWCLHAAMSPIADSRCPLDRGRFSHQPAVAVALHRAIARLFPVEYRRRARETREEEEASRTRSQAVEEEEEEEVEEGGEGEGETGERRRPPSSSSTSLPSTPRTHTPLSPLDFACSRPGCGGLLLDPVVLNCGHAVCSSCVPGGRACAACGGAGRVGGSAPRACALLAGLIEALFPAQVVARRGDEAKAAAAAAAATEEEERRRERAPPPPASDPLPAPSQPQQQQQQQQTPPPLPRRASSLDTHFGIGCDACGAYPIRGRRFRCLDCAESTAVGFDLCGDCFDQQQQGRREDGEDAAAAAAAAAASGMPRRTVNVDGRFAQVRFVFVLVRKRGRERARAKERERERRVAPPPPLVNPETKNEKKKMGKKTLSYFRATSLPTASSRSPCAEASSTGSRTRTQS